MGVALRNALIEAEEKKLQRKQTRLFLIVQRRLSDVGDAQAIKVAATNEKEARWLASRLYKACPPHLSELSYSLLDIEPITWLHRRFSDCLTLGRTLRRRGVLNIEVRQKNK